MHALQESVNLHKQQDLQYNLLQHQQSAMHWGFNCIALILQLHSPQRMQLPSSVRLVNCLKSRMPGYQSSDEVCIAL